ncbi:hypothetical protein AWZ03_007502 [Drosophila navojoa]|uniref:BEN domain-containing protein n=1 Tax=Drosophila navojoa TaxID=7232 RepID=A0A484BB70_DRONA|nr:early boundary activity protein 2 [Drosophila navojoa]TDG46053.1 hypothetical protein AWZ03_007502 [Drosophila navojoa]
MHNFHNINFEYKNGNVEPYRTPVQDSPESWTDQDRAAAYANLNTPINHLNIQPNNLPIAPFAPAPYSFAYQQFLSQFAPNLVPYYYTLLSPAPVNFNYQQSVAPAMDIEKYINYELSKQQSLMRKQTVRPHPLGVLRLPTIQPLIVPKKEPQERRVINVQMVSMSAPRSRETKNDVEPLPPVEPSFKEDVAKISKSQHHYTQLFDRLTSVLQTLNRRYDGNEPEPRPEVEHDEAPPPPMKRARHMSSSSSESHQDSENVTALSHYPQRVVLPNGSTEYVLGPNGTRIDAKAYGQVFWTSAPVATRCLLGAVFSNDELATHTLTGKPSPAFYGRERPAKKMLDQNRVDDIVVSVRNRTGCKERHIRATITTKCADTAKKYKRRAKKALKDNVIDE